jgi:hypothetical protein
MKNRRLLWVAVGGLAVALTLVLWPVHVQQAGWAVTVGDEEKRTTFQSVEESSSPRSKYSSRGRHRRGPR